MPTLKSKNAQREELRFRARGPLLLHDVAADLQYAARRLRQSPTFTIVAVLTLALGIGINTAVFGVFNTLLFQPLPYPDAEQLVHLFRAGPQSQSGPHTSADFLDYQEQNDVFEQMVAFRADRPTLVEPGHPAASLSGMLATGDLFNALRISPLMGRGFTADDAEPGARPVAVLSHRFWIDRFGGDPDIIGREIQLNGEAVEITGVMREAVLERNIDLWQPLSLLTPEARRNAGNGTLRILARRRDGITVQQAEAGMTLLARRIWQARSGRDTVGGIRLATFREVSADSARNLWNIFGLAGLVLLIACVNLATLQLARTTSTLREFSIRLALGGGRSRLMRQSLIESLLVSLLGGALSLPLALWSVPFLERTLFSDLPGLHVVADYRVLGFTFACAAATTLLFGAVPAWFASRQNVTSTLMGTARGATEGRSQRRLRHGLVVGEIALALVLLSVGALFIEGLSRFVRIDPGWRVDGLLASRFTLDTSRYADADPRLAFFDQLETRMVALPEVQSTALALSLPITSFATWGMPVRIAGTPIPAVSGDGPSAYFDAVTSAYFDTLGMTLIEGRPFTPADDLDHPPVVVVNDAVARFFWPDQSAIGKRLSAGDGSGRPIWREIVGVVNDVDFPASLLEPVSRLQIYGPLYQYSRYARDGVSVLVRTSGPPEATAPAFRRVLADIDPDLLARNVRSVRDTIDGALAGSAHLGRLLGTFGVFGLVLAAGGVYGVMSYSVAQRTHEIGIRLAMGAQRRDVLGLVLGQGLRLILAGSLLGLLGVVAATQLLGAMIPELPAGPIRAVGGVTGVLTTVTWLACYLPARRAAGIDPVRSLRLEYHST